MIKRNTGLGPFLIITLILAILGLVFIYSASSVFALEKYGQAAYFVYRQFFGLLLGLIGLLLAYAMPTNLIKKLSPYTYFLTLGLTALTLVPRFAWQMNGSSRWLKFAGIGLQPSEFLKLALIIYVAYLIGQKKYQKNSFWNSFIPLGLVFSLAAIVLLRQPDFGLTVVLSITLFALLLIARVSGVYLGLAFASFVPLAGLLVWFKPYRLKRVLIFLDPWSDPKGAGFQIIQSLIAVGSGGVWGLGIANSKQKFFYLPMQHTDFIFAIIAEELGFIGAMVMIVLYLLWLYFGMKLAWSLTDDFATYVTLGFVILISIQALINFGVVTGLLPTKGVGLPFVSYGCSSLIANLTMVGVLCRFVKNNERGIY